jgi:GNAT superfamily N-acetyltransferase
VLVREAEPADANDVAGVHVRSWQVGYRGLLPDDYLDRLRPKDRAQRYRFGEADPGQPATIVAVRRGAICGFATTAPSGDSDAQGSGELCALYVDPPSWGCGVGRALIASARDRLAGQGFADAVLWVLVGNARAERFYRMDGWRGDGTGRAVAIWGVTVDEIRYRRPITAGQACLEMPG